MTLFSLFPRRWAWLKPNPQLSLSIILGLLAAFTNLFDIPLFANAVLVLGGVFTMSAALIMASRYALLTSLIGCIGLLINWGHGWGFLWFPLEVLFVNLMVRQRVHPLLADLIYWALIGVPVVYLVLSSLHQLSSSMMMVLLCKQVFNGYLYTLLASFLTMLPAIRYLKGGGEQPVPSLQAYLTLAFGVICTLCLLVYGLISEQNLTQQHQKRIEQNLIVAQEQLAQDFSQEMWRTKGEFSDYGRLLKITPQGKETFVLAGLLRSNEMLLSVMVLTEKGQVLYSMNRNQLNQARRNRSESQMRPDQSSLERAKESQSASFSSHLQKVGFSSFPVLAVTAPIPGAVKGQEQLFVQGLVDLRALEVYLQSLFKEKGLEFLVLNRDEKVMMASSGLPLPLLREVNMKTLSQFVMPLPLAGVSFQFGYGKKNFFVYSCQQQDGSVIHILADAETELSLLERRYLGWALYVVISSLIAIYFGHLLSGLFSNPLLSLLEQDKSKTPYQWGGKFHYKEQELLYASLERKSKALKTYHNSLENQVSARTHELQRLNERMNRVLQSSSDGILEVDPRGQVIFMNHIMETWLAYRGAAEELELSTEQLLSPVAGLMTLEECLQETWENGSASHGEGVLELNGKILELEFHVNPVLQEDGEIGAVVMLHNVSHGKELQRSIEQARESAELANQAKTDFVANMSHEIRTPLNAITGLIQLFERSNLSQDQQQFLRRMEHGAELLQTIVSDILDFSKIESGHLELENQAFDIEALIAHLNLLMAARAQQGLLQLHCEVKPGVPKGLVGDPLRLTQVLMNLLSNAIKFTPQGRVEVTVTAPFPVNGKGLISVRFEVSDTGIGISQEKLESLFSPFTQADTATTRQYGGTGLGLAISERLVSLMNSELKVSSYVGQGSKFWFDVRMPVALPDQSLLQTPSNQLSAPSILFNQQTVLVVEDNEVNLQITKLMLERLGLTPLLATCGEEAIQQLLKHPEIDLILMDLQMPGQDGIQVTRQIRETLDLSQVPIVALTAHASLADKQRCLDSGMQEHLSKPVNMVELVRILSRFLAFRTVPRVESESRTPTPLEDDSTEQLGYFLARFGHLDQEIRSLAEFDAWGEAAVLVDKALQVTTNFTYKALRRHLFEIQQSIAKESCSPSQLKELQEHIEQLRLLQSRMEPV